MQKILLVEDAVDCQMIVNASLRNDIYLITIVTTLKEAQAEIRSTQPPFDLILLDLGLPDGDGFSLLGFLQSHVHYKNVPTLMLTGTTELSHKLKAFELGAEDYLTKPINGLELRARVDVRLRKADRQRVVPDLLMCGNLTLDHKNLQARVFDGTNTFVSDLTTKEFKLLSFLVQNENSVFSRAELVQAVCGKNVHIQERTIDSHISAIRRKIKPLDGYIQSEVGASYCLSRGIKLQPTG